MRSWFSGSGSVRETNEVDEHSSEVGSQGVLSVGTHITGRLPSAIAQDNITDDGSVFTTNSIGTQSRQYLNINSSSVSGNASVDDRGVNSNVEGRGIFRNSLFHSFAQSRTNATGTLENEREMERRIAVAARSLSTKVQQIVIAARSGGDEWKFRLLSVLGGADSDQPNFHPMNDGREENDGMSDVDVLLSCHPFASNFVLTCVRNELPPNLIHCLRLLRVLELQHAHQTSKDANGAQNLEIKPVSILATSKVSKLLCLLCTEHTVGEQLRPHLFGLLALSGASYPLSGVHVSRAASAVIQNFSEHCLTASLVWFLHDRKMIVHMTDDVKELCGTNASDSNNNNMCLFGHAAERAGLWISALRTVTVLITFSCQFMRVELLEDFDEAGGYQVLGNAILNSGQQHVPKLLELVTMLVYSKINGQRHNATLDDGASVASSVLEDNRGHESIAGTITEEEDGIDAKIATNPRAFQIVEDLMKDSIQFLMVYARSNQGQKPPLDNSLSSMAKLSVENAELIASTSGSEDSVSGSVPTSKVDLSSELLVTTLQLYSDHARNYEIIELRYNILSYYILSFPTFSDVSTKVLILKTLEFVCKGLVGCDSTTPLTVIAEIFFAICRRLLQRDCASQTIPIERIAVLERFDDLLLKDAEMLCDTLETLIQFDPLSVASVMEKCGMLVEKLNNVLSLVVDRADTPSPKSTNDANSEADGVRSSVTLQSPPMRTRMDGAYSVFCRILKLVVCHHHGAESSASNYFGRLNLNVLLCTGIKNLGNDACNVALSVFEAIMSSSYDTMRDDVGSLLEMLRHFSMLSSSSGKTKIEIDIKAIRRESDILKMLEAVMQSNKLARDVFRTSGGFEMMMRLVLVLKGALPSSTNESNDKIENNDERGIVILDLIKSIFSVIGTSTNNPMMKKSFSDTDTATNQIVDLDDDENSSLSPISKNRSFLRSKNFYISLSSAISDTGILQSYNHALELMNISLSIMDPNLSLNQPQSPGNHNRTMRQNGSKMDSVSNPKVTTLSNSGATRLVLGIAIYLPPSHVNLGKVALDEILRLCSPDMAGSTLPLMSSSGLALSLTSPVEFGPHLDDKSHPLYSRLILLLRRITAFSMSYIDFVSLLRFMAGPILLANDATSGGKKGRIELPVIKSSIHAVSKPNISKDIHSSSQERQSRDADLSTRLDTLCIIAERGDHVSRFLMGGDSLNTVALYMQKVNIDERLYSLAEGGRLSFLEVPKVDLGARSLDRGNSNNSIQTTNLQQSSSNNAPEKVWSPFTSTGFTYSVWLRLPKSGGESMDSGSLFLLDISSPPNSVNNNSSNARCDFLSIWLDLDQQEICVLSSTSSRNEPNRFDSTTTLDGIWHHFVFTYQPPKRPMLSRKATLAAFLDGRAIETELRVENVNIPPTARIHIGVPNPKLAASGIVRGPMPIWELGPSLMLCTVLDAKDATAIFAAGPDYHGLFWGDRPQRLSFTANATAAFVMLAKSGEDGSVACALRRRHVPELEAAGHVMRERGSHDDSLASVGLLCSVNPEEVIFGFHAIFSPSDRVTGLSSENRIQHCRFSRRVANVALLNTADNVASDAVLYGNNNIVAPNCFADNLQWVGGPNILLPLVDAVQSSACLALSLRLIRASVNQHSPNLECLQAGGGYRMLGLLLRQKRIMDIPVLEQCFAFAVHGFIPGTYDDVESSCSDWVFADLDAMKYLLLNHQVWDLRRSGPKLPFRLLEFLNGLVSSHNLHAAFNARRLHLLGIVRWVLHLILEAAMLFNAADDASSSDSYSDGMGGLSQRHRGSANSGASSISPGLQWHASYPSITSTSVGGDPGNPLLRGCKTLLRRVLTYMLTPGDLEGIAGATVYTLSISDNRGRGRSDIVDSATSINDCNKLSPGPVARVYLLRLLEELVVDGVNEIVVANKDKNDVNQKDSTKSMDQPLVRPHSGGGTSNNPSYLAGSIIARKKNRPQGQGDPDINMHPNHQQAQAFLSAFSGILTPVWFACILEGCMEEASAGAALRLMILLLQSSPTFAAAFEDAGGFAPLVLSIPKFSTCPSIVLSMLSQLLHAPILHLPCFGTLDASQLCEVFESASDSTDLCLVDSTQGGIHTPSDPSCGIFALLAECLGRNIACDITK